jgi:hypothetical protein
MFFEHFDIRGVYPAPGSASNFFPCERRTAEIDGEDAKLYCMGRHHSFASNFGCIPGDPFGRTIINPGLVLLVPRDRELSHEERRHLRKQLKRRAKLTHVAGECCTGHRR